MKSVMFPGILEESVLVYFNIANFNLCIHPAGKEIPQGKTLMGVTGSRAS